jgi:hypothetical protein
VNDFVFRRLMDAKGEFVPACDLFGAFMEEDGAVFSSEEARMFYQALRLSLKDTLPGVKPARKYRCRGYIGLRLLP